MRAFLTAIYSLVAYVFFLSTFLYAIAFVGNFVVPKTIDSGVPGDLTMSLLINAGLLGIFAVQHSVMARPAFKRWWTKVVPKEIERSTYVLFASAALALLLWQWRPMPQIVWSVTDPVGVAALYTGMGLGFAIVLLSTYLISHFHLFGLSQGMTRLLKLKEPRSDFVTPLFYRWVRHPLYLGFIIAFWSTPQMTVGHLFFAFATTAYIYIGIFLEERDLVAEFGERYLSYRAKVGMLMPRLTPSKERRIDG
jgi:protein-S-isoprenylcysteine O-methyltransferase Ste14